MGTLRSQILANLSAVKPKRRNLPGKVFEFVIRCGGCGKKLAYRNTPGKDVCFNCWYRAERAYKAAVRESKRWTPEAIEYRARVLRWYQRQRREALVRATPPWVTMVEIDEIYARCAKITAETGIVHHVDHIIPLTHPSVCGLHVPANLQVLTGEENCRKSNSFDG